MIGFQSCQAAQEDEHNCGSYCFKVVKPILRHIDKLHNQVSSFEERRNTQDLTAKYSDVMTKLTALEAGLADHEQRLLATEQKLTDQNKNFVNIGSVRYFIEDQLKMNWFAARYRCQELGAHLLSIQNEAEYKAIIAKLNREREYWIDINDLAQEGLFLSDTTGRPAAYLNWDPIEWNGHFQPDNRDNVEHCVHLFHRNLSLQMNDADCRFELNFICEI